mmetsp:Transcript_7178/g.21891  ORF Transcript_7178/g.21891 Transcript_7178/m.21891 type:complete len:405 (-) Transcript_7178:180-1394(-)|eukprot:CAMPEP_0198732948 /NCGR_PEP_ID=MMETSP1475-20131203/41325_1 /TAXON_ID= ORGANISM="Unidentified sp., Strain CCMP1999" /NCGR_SAMPLE_ID=MMETSP1475 /ASSEMBLY_ACC=CAM_ASM_001111 /LENGTH=404 /DNA_ID=CAMNT_0044496161 /DNA_START=150 /DNA_END=1364 /DNA_ORIENTATION=+
MASGKSERDVKYWRKLCPQLNISETRSSAVSKLVTAPSWQSLKDRFEEESVFCLPRAVENTGLVERLKEGADRLVRDNYPAVFLLLFDEAWLVMDRLTSLLQYVGGPKNVFNGDALVWHLDPNKNQAGFSPHRDRQPDDIAASFHADGLPKYLTCWLALSPATPENSCLYVIPRPHDPGYHEGDVDDIHPLQRALPDKEAYQHIRALPLETGGCAVFSHRIIHWGSQGRKGPDVQPRVSMSFSVASPDFEACYLSDEAMQELPLPSFDVRLALVCSQIISYHSRLRPDLKLLSTCHGVVKSFPQHLSEGYRKKVLGEFVDAVKALDKDSGDADGENSDLAEEMMDAMLEVGEGVDDFDGLEEKLDTDTPVADGDESEDDDVEEELSEGDVAEITARVLKRQRTS